MRTFDIVVAHHGSRDFELLVPLVPEARFVVYDKSGRYPGECIRVPNVGREGSVYLTHIIDNYDSLADRTLFIQDDVMKHRTNLLSFVAEVLSDSSDFRQYPCTWNALGPVYTRTIVGGLCDLPELGRPDLIKVACDELHIDLPQEYTTETCAFFSASREMIRARGKDFYAAIRDWASRSDSHEVGLEHMWAIIF